MRQNTTRKSGEHAPRTTMLIEPRQSRRRGRQENKHPMAPGARQTMWKRRMLSLGLGLAILCALFLPAQIRVWKSQSALNNLQSQKQALYLQQQQIQRQIGYYNSAAYVEEAARQNLGLVNPGESLVLPAVAGKAMPLAQTYHSSAIGPYGD